MKLASSLTLIASLTLSACGGSGFTDKAPQSQAPDVVVSSTTGGGRMAAGVTTFSGNRANYTVVKTTTGVTVTDNVGAGGSMTLVAPTRLVFADAGIAFDVNGIAGKAYRIYQAAFNRTPDLAGLGYWIEQMDKGQTLDAVAGQFIGSPEFVTQYGLNPSNRDMVGKFYQNVLHRIPDQAGFDYWVKVLDTNAASSASVLAGFGESPENQAQVVAAIANGISYNHYKPAVPVVPPAGLGMAAFTSCPDASASQSKQFYTCMVGSITGKSMFGNAACTMTIAPNGELSLASGALREVVAQPYHLAVYSKTSVGSPDTFFLLASVTSAGYANKFEMKVTSPKYAALAGGTMTPGIQADVGELSCQFAL